MDLNAIKSLWPKYFPKESYSNRDVRHEAINLFLQYLNRFCLKVSKKANVELCCMDLQKNLSLDDFLAVLRSRPCEVIGCMGIALSLIAFQQTGSLCPKYPRFRNFYPFLSFGDIKADVVGQLTSIRGYVVKVGLCSTLIESAVFWCPKCLGDTVVCFEDGVFCPPQRCSTPK